ncbi:hypothetical protein LguiA_001396 [Lonicera macranthoides]
MLSKVLKEIRNPFEISRGTARGSSCCSNSSVLSSAQQEEINIYLKVIKIVALKVKRSETIRNLKALLWEKEDVSEHFQELYFSGVMKLFVTIISKQKTIEIDAQIQDTIKSIKSKVQAKEGILSHRFSLFYDGTLLENNRTLASFDIKRESTLHLIFNPRDILSVSVKMPDGKIVKMEAKLLYTVGNVKEMAESRIGFPNRVFHKLQRLLNDFHYLVFGGKRLEDCRDLASYGIKKQSTLNMVFRPTTFFPIKLSTIGDFQTGLRSSTPIGELKKLIERKRGKSSKGSFPW